MSHGLTVTVVIKIQYSALVQTVLLITTVVNVITLTSLHIYSHIHNLHTQQGKQITHDEV